MGVCLNTIPPLDPSHPLASNNPVLHKIELNCLNAILACNQPMNDIPAHDKPLNVLPGYNQAP